MRRLLAPLAIFSIALCPCSVAAQKQEAGRIAVSVKDFGAVCDGVADDTTKIQLALDSGAKRVRVPSAVCRTSTLSIPSNVEFMGEGWSSVLLLKDDAGGAVVLVADGASNVLLRDFKVSANSRKQIPSGRSSGILVHQNARRVHIENVWVDDVADWGFHINGSDVTLRHTRATNITGARGEHTVRAGYLVGSGVPPVAASRVTIENAEVAECALPHTDGFILERGTEIVLRHSRAVGCSWTCFKLKTSQTRVSGNSASGCGVGFQTQGPLQDLMLTNNTSSRNKGSGYQFNQVSSVVAGRNWRISHNEAKNNGQPPGNSTTYGFAFENVPDARTEEVFIAANTAIDDQLVRTQARGISFGTHGQYTNVHLSNNLAKGNTVDYFLGPSVDFHSLTDGQNNVGSAGTLSLRRAR